MRHSGRDIKRCDGFTLVELIVAVLVMAIVATGITTVVVSTMRVENDQHQLQEVIDDGRLSLTRVRQEVREARRVLEGSDASHLYFWVDRNQDALIQPEELVCYAVEELEPGAERYRLARWTGAEDGCSGDDIPPGAQTLAATLVDPEPFTSYTPDPPVEGGDVNAPPTREVGVLFDLEVEQDDGLGSIHVTGSIRLRNVP